MFVISASRDYFTKLISNSWFRLIHLACIVLITGCCYFLYMNKNFIDNNGLRWLPRNNSIIFIEDNSTTVNLVMFTTFKEIKTRQIFELNVLHNWSRFADILIPVMFTKDTKSTFADEARSLGWMVFPMQSSNSYGTPHLKPMLAMMRKQFPKVTCYGFANGDIMFDNTFRETMQYFRGVPEDKFRNMLLVGRRTNVKTSPNNVVTIKDLQSVTNLKKIGHLFSIYAQDYFIFKGTYPWGKIPNFVIGRPGYDNYLVNTAVDNEISLIDVTKTMTVIHQTGIDGNSAGFKNIDATYNNDLIKTETKGLNMIKGGTNSASLRTNRDSKDKIYVENVIPSYAPKKIRKS